jgi:hypothetical protein
VNVGARISNVLTFEDNSIVNFGFRLIFIGPLERSEKDCVLPRCNSGGTVFLRPSASSAGTKCMIEFFPALRCLNSSQYLTPNYGFILESEH